MIVEPTVAGTRSVIAQWRASGYRISLVPTMGYFHAGHRALMAKAREAAERVVVSLFVNPTQFGPQEDFAAYPRDSDGDRAQAAASGVDLLFCPDVAEMYGNNDQTVVSVERLSQGLCGDGRPGHFRGVATVVTKLLHIIQPDSAVFGEKDFQQLTIIRQLVRDLHVPVTIIGHPTVREPDGLAMSSRNAYLSAEERRAALVLYRALVAAKKAVADAPQQITGAELQSIGKRMIAAQPLCELEYFTVVAEDTLEQCHAITPGCRAIGAIRVGSRVRLIDNLSLF